MEKNYKLLIRNLRIKLHEKVNFRENNNNISFNKVREAIRVRKESDSNNC